MVICGVNTESVPVSQHVLFHKDFGFLVGVFVSASLHQVSEYKDGFWRFVLFLSVIQDPVSGIPD